MPGAHVPVTAPGTSGLGSQLGRAAAAAAAVAAPCPEIRSWGPRHQVGQPGLVPHSGASGVRSAWSPPSRRVQTGRQPAQTQGQKTAPGHCPTFSFIPTFQALQPTIFRHEGIGRLGRGRGARARAEGSLASMLGTMERGWKAKGGKRDSQQFQEGKWKY